MPKQADTTWHAESDPDEMVRAIAIDHPDRASISWNSLWFCDSEVEASFQVECWPVCCARNLVLAVNIGFRIHASHLY